MIRVNVTFDPATVKACEALCERYGNAGSLSSVVRRAVALLAARWEKLDEMPRARAQEVASFAAFLGTSQRGHAEQRTANARRQRG